MKRLLFILFYAVLFSFLFSCSSSKELKEGWHHTRELKKKGYTLDNSFKGWVHVRETSDSTKQNIFKIKTL